jgi:hypothetical protein
MLNRRSLITGLISLVAAPAIVRPTSIMPIKSLILPDEIVAISPVMWEDLLHARMNAVYEITRQAVCASLYSGDNRYERLNVLHKL